VPDNVQFVAVADDSLAGRCDRAIPFIRGFTPAGNNCQQPGQAAGKPWVSPKSPALSAERN